ncbi:MAG: ribose-phosphate diphosphokinase [Ketobacteraceae bacterium]|nr:ribose-phosphate diphosphokinase [Ketobacteraceae bacterium]
MQILSFDDYRQQASALAEALQGNCERIRLHRFPDGESLVQLPSGLDDHLVICQSLHFPNDKLVELYLAAKSARQHGVKRLTLVAPYLCYMRQDKAFIPGQAVSQQIIGSFLGDLFDDVVTVDPHLHRIERLDQAIPCRNAVALTAAGLLGDFVTDRFANAVFIGPDEESEQWVKVVAQPGDVDYVVASKIRYGDKSVAIELPDYDFSGRTALLVDDVISSGHTVAETARELQKKGVSEVLALCTHALLAPGAEKLLEENGVDRLISTDSIPHSSNEIQLAPLLAEAVKKLED